MFWPIAIAISVGAVGLAVLLWRLDDRQERRWQRRQQLEGMARLLGASKDFQAAANRCVETIHKAGFSVDEWRQRWECYWRSQ